MGLTDLKRMHEVKALKEWREYCEAARLVALNPGFRDLEWFPPGF